VIVVHNRKTGQLEQEKIPEYIKVSLRLMYSSRGGRFAVEGHQLKKVLHHMSQQQGKKYDSPGSKKEIEHFIHFHGLDTNEIRDPLDSFNNFNEFFYRKLKVDARPLASTDPKVAVSGADSRLNVFPSIDQAKKIWIKGEKFSLSHLAGEELAKEFDGSSLVIFRLAPQDYHRFHSPVDGVVGKMIQHFDGALFTVNPIAIRENVDVYTENKRLVTTIRSPQFGNVLFIAVGATMVGSIVMTQEEGATVKRGDEMGYFAFGGSTILTLFKPNVIQYDEDLLLNSTKPIETLVKVGDRIGIKK